MHIRAVYTYRGVDTFAAQKYADSKVASVAHYAYVREVQLKLELVVIEARKVFAVFLHKAVVEVLQRHILEEVIVLSFFERLALLRIVHRIELQQFRFNRLTRLG